MLGFFATGDPPGATAFIAMPACPSVAVTYRAHFVAFFLRVAFFIHAFTIQLSCCLTTGLRVAPGDEPAL